MEQHATTRTERGVFRELESGILPNTPSFLYSITPCLYERSPSGVVLLRGPPWRDYGGGPEYPLWNPAAGGQRTGCAIGSTPGSNALTTPANCANAAPRKAIPLHS